MDGVTLSDLKQIHHPQGDIYHAVKKSSVGFENFGEAYFTTINNSETKGWKKHSKMVLNLIVPTGKVEFVIYNGEKFFTVVLSQENYKRLTISPNLWVAFRGLGDKLNLVLNVASIEHDPNEAINIDLEEINYEW